MGRPSELVVQLQHTQPKKLFYSIRPTSSRRGKEGFLSLSRTPCVTRRQKNSWSGFWRKIVGLEKLRRAWAPFLHLRSSGWQLYCPKAAWNYRKTVKPFWRMESQPWAREARAQILSRHLKGRGTALRADEFLAMNSKTEGRDLSKANDVVFIYHNEIDAVGDKRDTEHRTCAAVESAIENVVKILKKAAAMNVSHMVVTADHGFLYQHEPVAESDFLNSPQVSETVKIDRRFVVTSQLSNDPKLRNFTAAQLGLKGASHLSFPKGTLRLRLQGSGSRYVHGGTSLQEVVIPVIEVKKERASDVGFVQVDILRSSQQITTGQVTVTFLQNEPVSDKCLGRELRAAFYSKTDVPLSDIKVLSFVATDEDARLRERSERFIFSRAADAFNQQDVVLRLVEQVAGTIQFALYKEFVFRLRRAFESDFDEL